MEDSRKNENKINQDKIAGKITTPSVSLENESLLNLLKVLNTAVSEQKTDNLTATEQVKELFNYYESIMACMPNNVYWLDRNCVLLGGNDDLVKMFGLKSRAELVGLSYEDMASLANWTEGQGEVFKKAELEVMSTGIPRFNVEEPPVTIDGKKRYYMSSKVPLYNRKGEVIGVVGISTDITERKQAEIALREAKDKAEAASKAKTEFLENMRHDIRTPLTGIVGFANIIKDEVKDSKIKEYADNLTTSCNALLDLMNEILDVIRLNSGEIPILKKKFNLKKRLQDVIKLNQAKANQKKIDLIFNSDDKIPSYVIGDPTRIHRVVLELITNALNYTDKGYVRLTTQLAKAENRDLVIKLIIEDTGIGIPVEKQQDIYQQFRRLTPSYEGIYKGAGLGLSIVRQFLDEMDAEIYVESQLKIGTKFTCVIPLKKSLLEEEYGSDDTTVTSFSDSYIEQTEINPIENSNGKESLLQKNNILIVEDQPIAATIVKNILINLNCRTDVVENGKIAVQQAATKHYDLIFMDIGLPEIDGYEATRLIRLNELKKGIRTPIIALTAHVDEENKQKCFDAGMNAVLTKPLDKKKAEDMLNAFIPSRYKQVSQVINEVKEEIIISEIQGKIIDLEVAKNLLGENEALINDMLNMLLNSLPEELTMLSEAYNKNDWISIKNIAHKLKGGCSYCGAVRLNKASTQLENAIREGKGENFTFLYQRLLAEIKAVEYTIKNKQY